MFDYCQTNCIYDANISVFSEHISLVPVAHFRSSGIFGDAFLNQNGSNVRVDFHGSGIISFGDLAQWQIHNVPTDYTVHPKLRCTSKFIGLPMYSGGDGDHINDVNATSFLMHSVVLLIANQVVACGIIHLDSPFYISATAKFSLGVFGRMYIIEWPGKYTHYCNRLYMYTCMQKLF